MDVLRIQAPGDFALLSAARPAGVLVLLPGVDPLAALEAVREMHPGVPVAFCRESGPAAEAVRLLRLGADDYFDSIANAGAWNPQPEARPVHAEPWRQFLIGESPAMQPVIDTIRLLGPRKSTVLIQGETGTGKEMVARALHAASPRSLAPLVSVNCTALPDSLLEAELFGHTRGAFTGAMQGRMGRFEQAQRGSIFLDEIGDMPFDVQAKLLRVLQEKEFQKLGSSETVKLDVRVISATNAALERKIEKGEFREDLYYRLNVVPLFLPPLRERWQDIPLLVNHFIEKICRAENLPGKVAFPETMEQLQRYSWPGNVRQLENTVERAIILSGTRTALYPHDFNLPRTEQARKLIESTPPAIAVPETGMDLQQTVQKLERTLIEQALRRTGGNKSQAADILGMKRTTLTARLKVLEAAV